MIINAENKVLGRLASEIASNARDGEEVKVVNAEKAVISGDEEQVKADYKQKYDRGGRYTGPHYPKSPARILKRTVRGMVSDNKEGREAFKRVKAYIGVPDDLEDYEEVDTKEGEDLQNRNYVKLGEVSRFIGWTPRGEA
ncbi:MAG: 50S ribosomal protein L13 [Candidatus Nanohaloarchaea archaeon]